MRFGGEVHHGIDRLLLAPLFPLPGQEFPYQIEIANIPVHERVPAVAHGAVPLLHVGEALEVSGVGQGIQVDHVGAGVVLQHPAHEVRPDEPGAAGHQRVTGLEGRHRSRVSLR